MSLASLEREILHAARVTFGNSKLRKKDLLEWSSDVISPEADDEVSAKLDDPNVWVTVPKACDKR